jgi:hypothetical protein
MLRAYLPIDRRSIDRGISSRFFYDNVMSPFLATITLSHLFFKDLTPIVFSDFRLLEIIRISSKVVTNLGKWWFLPPRKPYYLHKSLYVQFASYRGSHKILFQTFTIAVPLMIIIFKHGEALACMWIKTGYTQLCYIRNRNSATRRRISASFSSIWEHFDSLTARVKKKKLRTAKLRTSNVQSLQAQIRILFWSALRFLYDFAEAHCKCPPVIFIKSYICKFISTVQCTVYVYIENATTY